MLVDTFRKRFTTSNAPSQRSLKNYTDVIQPCINASDNDRLLAPVFEEELFEAVKSIGALKAPALMVFMLFFTKISGITLSTC